MKELVYFPVYLTKCQIWFKISTYFKSSLRNKCSKEYLAVRSSLKISWGLQCMLRPWSSCIGTVAQAFPSTFGQCSAGMTSSGKSRFLSLCFQSLAWIFLHYTNSCKKLLLCCQLAFTPQPADCQQ